MSNHKKITSTERFTDKEDTMQNISTTDMEGFQGNIVSHPMTEDDLLSVLHEIPVTGQSEKDLQAALRFVSDYLCDQDNAMTNSKINTEVRSHFKLTPNQLKLLNTLYRQVSKAYQAGKHTKNAQSKTEIPAWYKKNSSGGICFLPGVLAEYMSQNEKIFFAGEEYYQYHNGVYVRITKGEVQRLVLNRMLIEKRKMAQVVDTESQWKLLIQKNISELNTNPYIINVQNGLYDVLNDTLSEHTPDYLSTIQLKVNYNKETDCPLFKKFLKESMGGDMEQVGLIQEILGYLLIPVNSAQKCFVFVGEANAGKSVLLRVINEILLGPEYVSNISFQSLNDRFKVAELHGKLANIFADLPKKNITDNGIFKAIVGEDHLTAEKKNKDPFSFQSTARLVFSCNDIPKNCGDRSEGFYRRLIIIRFNHRVPKDKRDPGLLEKFRTEADGIFLFALEGLRRLIEKNYVFSETETNADELQKYREQSDSVLSFIKDCCEQDITYCIGSTELFREYQEYCRECGMQVYSHKKFVQQAIDKFPLITRSINHKTNKRSLTGIKLKELRE